MEKMERNINGIANLKISEIDVFDKLRDLNFSLDNEKSLSSYFKRIKIENAIKKEVKEMGRNKNGDINDLWEKILWAVNNLEKSKKIANNGRSFMFQNMTAEINADKVYEKIESFVNRYYDQEKRENFNNLYYLLISFDCELAKKQNQKHSICYYS